MIDELAVLPADYVVDKYWCGAFFRTHLYDILLSEHVYTTVVCGTVTQIWVEETARESFRHCLKTVVLSDGVSSYDRGMHAAALKNFALKFGRVLDCKTLPSRWSNPRVRLRREQLGPGCDSSKSSFAPAAPKHRPPGSSRFCGTS